MPKFPLHFAPAAVNQPIRNPWRPVFFYLGCLGLSTLGFAISVYYQDYRLAFICLILVLGFACLVAKRAIAIQENQRQELNQRLAIRRKQLVG